MASTYLCYDIGDVNSLGDLEHIVALTEKLKRTFAGALMGRRVVDREK